MLFLQTERELVDTVIYHAGNAQHDDAGRAQQEADARVVIALEGNDGLVALVDVHGLHHAQVVVQGQHRVDQSDEHQQVEAAFEGCREDEELREEACEGRDACQGEQGQRHQEGQARVGGVQAIIVCQRYLARALHDDVDDREDAQVGEEVNQHVVNQRGHTHRRAGDDAQHDVACLRDAGEGHQSHQVLLAQGEEVGQGDGENDDPVEDSLPFRHHRGEHLDEDQHQHEGCRAFGNDAQVGRHRAGRTLVDVGRPQVEGNQRNLEAHTGEEEHQCHDLQGAAVQGGGDILEVEGARRAVYQRQAEQQQGAGEHGCQDILGTSLGGLEAELVEGDQSHHRDAGRFKSDEEHQEVSGRNHEVHAQQGGERQDVELALLDVVLLAAHPFVCHQEHDERAYAQDRLHDALGGRGDVHATESGSLGTGHQRDNGVYQEQRNRQERVQHRLPVALVVVRTHEEVCDEKNDDDGNQRQLFFHH